MLLAIAARSCQRVERQRLAEHGDSARRIAQSSGIARREDGALAVICTRPSVLT
jgi:hypothetical protein